MEDFIQETALVRSAAEANAELERMPDGSLGANACYCKILVTNHLAGIIIGQSGNDIRTLKSTTGAKIVRQSCSTPQYHPSLTHAHALSLLQR